MTPLLRRPILVGGLGLTASAWLLHGMHSTLSDFSGTAVWGAIALGSGLWWLKQQIPAPLRLHPAAPIDRASVEQALATVESRIQQLAVEMTPAVGADAVAAPVERFQQAIAALRIELDRPRLRLGVVGGAAVGKTTLAQRLARGLSLDTQPEIRDAAGEVLEDIDLVLFVTAGDLTDSEFQLLQQLRQQNHRVLLVFNKQDQYLPGDRPVILQQLRDRLRDCLPAADIIAISAQPAPVKVRQHQMDGSVAERIEQPAPELAPLQQRLHDILAQQSPVLVLATVLRQAQGLNRAVQLELNQLRRARAMPIIEQYQWIAAAAAFANPVPSLDLLATATINAQLVVDLGAIYQQTFSLEQAKTVMGNLASQMVKLGLVEVASQAIAPLLKSHALTYVAGGTMQGLSAAYLTRLAGLSLVEYFEEQSQTLTAASPLQLDRLVQKLKAVFQENQRSAFLQTLVKQGLSRLQPQTTAALVQTAES